jgi:hypothetical protein
MDFCRILEAGEANGTFGGVRSGVIVLLSTPRIYHCIASEAAKCLSLDVFSQVYMGWFLSSSQAVPPEGNTSLRLRFSFWRHMQGLTENYTQRFLL